MITADWLAAAVAAVKPDGESGGEHVRVLKEKLIRWADGFAEARSNVISASLEWPRRGLHSDEAASFLRAVDLGQASVDSAGYVTMHCVRPKTPPGRYALFSKSGDGVALNLEYVIQIGATAELVLDLGWSPASVDFERGEFDALGLAPDGRVVLAVEAKARATGSDSLQKMVSEWINIATSGVAPPATNSGRKYRELLRLCESGQVTVWLVAAGVRWAFVATADEGVITLVPTSAPTYLKVANVEMEGRALLCVRDFDSSLHRPGTLASRGLCSWLCTNAAQYSVRVRELAGSESSFALCETHREQVERVYDK